MRVAKVAADGSGGGVFEHMKVGADRLKLGFIAQVLSCFMIQEQLCNQQSSVDS